MSYQTIDDDYVWCYNISTMPSARYESAPIKVLPDTYACPSEERLSYADAAYRTGVHCNTPTLCTVVAALALHEGEVPLTQDALRRSTGYTQAMVSKAVNFLYLTGVVEQGGLVREGVSSRSIATFVPAEDFAVRVSAVPVWQETVDTERQVRRLDKITAELGLDATRADGLRVLIDFYEQNGPSTAQ